MYVQSFIKMYVQSFTKMYVQSFTNLTQDKSEWSTSKPCSLSPNEEPPLTSRQMARWAPQPVWMLWITEYLSLLMTALPQSHSPSAFNQLYLDIFFHLGFHLLWVPVLVWYHCSCSGVISLFLFLNQTSNTHILRSTVTLAKQTLGSHSSLLITF